MDVYFSVGTGPRQDVRRSRRQYNPFPFPSLISSSPVSGFFVFNDSHDSS